MLLYLGNNIRSKLVTETTMVILGRFLEHEGYKVKLVSSKKNKFLRLLSMLWSIIVYRKQIDYVLVDTYSTQNFYYAVLSGKLCRVLSLKYIPILHGGNLPERLDRSSKLSRILFENSYINVSPSNYLKQEFKKRGYKTIFIPNILEIEKYQFSQRGFSVPKLLYVRAFASIYNPNMAIKVLKEIKKNYPKAILCMIGPEKDSSYKECVDLSKSLNLEDSIEFTGKLSKEAWHKKAKEFNIFINTTNIDNTPVSVMEAMALGLPIVSTNVGGMPFLIHERETGLLVNKGDVNAMAKAISMICSNDDLANKLTANARTEVEKFDWSIIKEQWKNILQ